MAMIEPTPRENHEKAMALADQASWLRRREPEKARELFRQAAELERSAMAQETGLFSHVICRSAAWLYHNAGRYQEAEATAALGLTRNPPPDLRQELAEVIDRCHLDEQFGPTPEAAGAMAEHRPAGLRRLLQLAQELKIVQQGDYTLANGGQSQWYCDASRLTLHPEASDLTSRMLLLYCWIHEAQAVAGPELSGAPLATAVALASRRNPVKPEDPELPALILRRQAKAHGPGGLIMGIRPPGGAEIALVDDVCTTGASLLFTATRLQGAGYEIIAALSVIDRPGFGGSAAIQKYGIPFRSLLTLEENSGRLRPSERQEDC